MTDYCDKHGHVWPEIFLKAPEHHEHRRCMVCEKTLIFMPANTTPGLWVEQLEAQWIKTIQGDQ